MIMVAIVIVVMTPISAMISVPVAPVATVPIAPTIPITMAASLWVPAAPFRHLHRQRSYLNCTSNQERMQELQHFNLHFLSQYESGRCLPICR